MYALYPVIHSSILSVTKDIESPTVLTNTETNSVQIDKIQWKIYSIRSMFL